LTLLVSDHYFWVRLLCRNYFAPGSSYAPIRPGTEPIQILVPSTLHLVTA